MVDFRYHLVSLIAVFMALAVGIILGAGPLQNSIGTALSDQVESLRTSRDEARADVDRMTQEVGKYQEGLNGLASELTSDALAGQAIVLIVMPGADSQVVDDQQTALEQSGAVVAGRITIADGAVSPEAADYRATMTRNLGWSVSGGVASTQGRLANAIIKLVSDGPFATQNLIDALQSGDEQMLEISDALSAQATGLVVVAGPSPQVPADTTFEPDPSFAATVELVTALGKMPTVVVGDDGEHGLVATIRTDHEGALSTVDSPDDPTAKINVPLALTQELAGGSVAWGLGESATTVIGSRASIEAPALAPGEPTEGPS